MYISQMIMRNTWKRAANNYGHTHFFFIKKKKSKQGVHYNLKAINSVLDHHSRGHAAQE